MASFKKYIENKDKQLISRMINSVFYFLKFVFILKEDNHYRLVVIQDKHKIIDLSYKTCKGAKIACSRILRNRFNNKGIRPVWSFFYPADQKWLKDKLNRKNGNPIPLQPVNDVWNTAPRPPL